MLLYDPIPHGGQRLTLFGDGRIAWVDLSDWADVNRKSSKARIDLMRQGR
jgi:hypothetical protein